MIRNSNVTNIYINACSYSSIIQLGDAVRADPYLRAIAVQREGAFFDAEDFPYEEYSIFTRPFTEMESIVPLSQAHIHHEPKINVHAIDMEGVSGSSIVQVGSLKDIDAKSRIKHIRILARET
ncbi:spore germination protein PE [Salirhabdus euzebyi]|uniref:Spore germination protein PE n=1 Tax=Salirhabdus euzebyi TaxID=394506 RepID=A0A841Q3N5_9BACI|nr:spore germination protein GerPE [Salirhabdus euzebyi]MBB6452997.1 spore germination protein PE [Salirhabdus euzebyi]